VPPLLPSCSVFPAAQQPMDPASANTDQEKRTLLAASPKLLSFACRSAADGSHFANTDQEKRTLLAASPKLLSFACRSAATLSSPGASA